MWLHPLQLPALWSRDSGLAAGAAADARGARVDAVREGGIVSCGTAIPLRLAIPQDEDARGTRFRARALLLPTLTRSSAQFSPRRRWKRHARR